MIQTTYGQIESGTAFWLENDKTDEFFIKRYGFVSVLADCYGQRFGNYNFFKPDTVVYIEYVPPRKALLVDKLN